jgi:pyrophosphatase PpaX
MGKTAVCQGVLFDLDGTLIDTRDFYLIPFRRVLREQLGVALTSALIAAHFGKTTAAILAEFAPPERIPELQAHLMAYQEEEWDRVQPFPGITDLLTTLKEAGLRLGVVTSMTRASCERVRAHLTFTPLIDAWVTASDTPRPKPDPEPIHLGVARLALTAAQVVVIGDTGFDMGAAQAAGLRVGAALWGTMAAVADVLAYRPNWAFYDPAEVLSALLPDTA